MHTVVTRFAPSPTGFLHRGHAASALFAWRLAREAGGQFLLRIEDIDQQRCREEFVTAIVEDLTWLGIDWDGAIRVQSQHLPEYRARIEQLKTMGLLYPCFCTRKEIAAAFGAPHQVDAPYPGTCRSLPRSEIQRKMEGAASYAFRLDMAAALRHVQALRWYEDGQGWITAEPARFGDVVLARKDVPASYHLCVTHDDALQNVTLVTRGIDLKPLTDVQVLLCSLFHWPIPRYRHHPLLTDKNGRRLAKRGEAEALRTIRAGGTEASMLRDALLPDYSTAITLCP